MSMTERLRSKDNFSQRLTTEQLDNELIKKIRAIKVFPGNLDEFARVNGGEYEFVKLPAQRQFLEGIATEREEVDDDGRSFLRKRHFLNPLSWSKRLTFIREAFHSQIKLQAVELGADALIHYMCRREINFFGGLYRETGVPIRRIDILSSLQK